MRNGFIRRNRALDKKMWLAIPAEWLEIKGSTAKVGFGEGVLRDVNVMLVDAKVREYVSVHARYVIQVIERKAAEENAW